MGIVEKTKKLAVMVALVLSMASCSAHPAIDPPQRVVEARNWELVEGEECRVEIGRVSAMSDGVIASGTASYVVRDGKKVIVTAYHVVGNSEKHDGPVMLSETPAFLFIKSSPSGEEYVCSFSNGRPVERRVYRIGSSDIMDVYALPVKNGVVDREFLERHALTHGDSGSPVYHVSNGKPILDGVVVYVVYRERGGVPVLYSAETYEKMVEDASVYAFVDFPSVEKLIREQPNGKFVLIVAAKSPYQQ